MSAANVFFPIGRNSSQNNTENITAKDTLAEEAAVVRTLITSIQGVYRETNRARRKK